MQAKTVQWTVFSESPSSCAAKAVAASIQRLRSHGIRDRKNDRRSKPHIVFIFQKSRRIRFSYAQAARAATLKFLPCAFSLLPPGILIQLSLLPLLSFHQKVHWNIEITPFQPCEQWLLPLSLDELVPQNHFVRIVSKTVDETRNRRSICPKHKRRRRKQIQSDYVV